MDKSIIPRLCPSVHPCRATICANSASVIDVMWYMPQHDPRITRSLPGTFVSIAAAASYVVNPTFTGHVT